MKRDEILVAGIGNIFFGDDAFGSEVARRLLARTEPAGIRVVDFGIRGLDLAYALLDGYRTVILIDAAPRGGVPGTLYLLELKFECEGPETPDGHSLGPQRVLRLAASLGAQPERVLLVGCEPTPFHPDEMECAMSPAVSAAIERAVEFVESLVHELLVNDGAPIEELTSLAKDDRTCRA
jgi:hydrogenase maturation protease